MCKILETKINKSNLFVEKCIKCNIYRTFINKEIQKIKTKKSSRLLKLILKYISLCEGKPIFYYDKKEGIKKKYEREIEDKINKSSKQMCLKTYSFLHYVLNKKECEQSNLIKCIDSKCLKCELYKEFRRNGIKQQKEEKEKQLKECKNSLKCMLNKNLIVMTDNDERINKLQQQIKNLNQNISIEEENEQWDKEYLEHEVKMVSAWKNFKYDSSYRGF